MAELPGAAVKRLITKAGGDMRVSASALKLAVAAAEDYISRLAREASSSAAGERRKTIMDGDVQKARGALG